MRYIKKLNIDFNNWENVDDSLIGPIEFGKSKDYYKNLIGKGVKLSKNSIYYKENTPSNPSNINGIIKDFNTKAWYNLKPLSFLKIDDNHYFNVIWDNGKSNRYRIKDLELI